jgi:hypothetical protein
MLCRIWPVDSELQAPIRSCIADFVSTYFGKCRQMRFRPSITGTMHSEAFCTQNMQHFKPYLWYITSALTSKEVSARSLIQALECRGIDLKEYKDIGTRNWERGTLLPTLKGRVSATPAPRGLDEIKRWNKKRHCQDSIAVLLQNPET